MGEISDKQQAISDTSDDLAFSDEEKTVINNNLQVLGKATVEDLGVTGRITSGLLVIEGLGQNESSASIYTLSGKLKLQELALGEIEMMGGKILFDTKGNIKVMGTIVAERIETERLELGEASSGQAVLGVGETEVQIDSEAVYPGARVLLTATTLVDEPLVVVRKEQGYFLVGLLSPQEEEVEFDWVVIE
jgi:hypothetical protein